MRSQSRVGIPKRKRISLKEILKSNWQLYVLVLPAVIYFFVFNYMPSQVSQIFYKYPLHVLGESAAKRKCLMSSDKLFFWQLTQKLGQLAEEIDGSVWKRYGYFTATLSFCVPVPSRLALP